jgi:hypothetical protein
MKLQLRTSLSDNDVTSEMFQTQHSESLRKGEENHFRDSADAVLGRSFNVE